MVRLELIEDVSGLRGLEDAWLDSCSGATRPASTSPGVDADGMVAVFYAGRRLFVVAAWDGVCWWDSRHCCSAACFRWGVCFSAAGVHRDRRTGV